MLLLPYLSHACDGSLGLELHIFTYRHHILHSDWFQDLALRNRGDVIRPTSQCFETGLNSLCLFFYSLVLRAFMAHCTTVVRSANAMCSLKRRKRVFRHVPKISRSDYYLCDVCLSTRNIWTLIWTDFREIWYLIIFREIPRESHFSLKSDKNRG